MLVIYQNQLEVLVCDKTHEDKLIKEWFGEKMHRKVSDFSRYETDNVVSIANSMRIFF